MKFLLWGPSLVLCAVAGLVADLKACNSRKNSAMADFMMNFQKILKTTFLQKSLDGGAASIIVLT